MQAHSPKSGAQEWARVAAQTKGMPVLFCSKHARLNVDSHKQCKDICTASGSVQDLGATPGTTDIKVDLLPHSAKQLHQESSKTVCGWQHCFLGSGAMFACAYPHTSRGSSVKFAIRIALAAKLLRMCSKATKHGVTFRIGLATKLLRMRSKATKDDFAIRTGSATNY